MARTPKKPKGEVETSEKVQENTDDATTGLDAETEERILSDEAHVDEQSADMSEPYALTDDAAVDTAVNSSDSDDIVTEESEAEHETVALGGDEDRAPGTLPDVDTSSPASVSAPPPSSGTGASPILLVLGGAIAAGLGWLAATLTADAPVMPTAPSNEVSSELERQAARVEDLASELTTLRETASPPGENVSEETASRLDSVEASLAEAIAALGARLEGVEGQPRTGDDTSSTRITELDTRLGEIDERLTTLETAEPATPDGSAAMEAQLEEFRSQLDAVTADAERQIEDARARATEIEQQAAAEAATASRAAAIADIRAALQSGEGYSEPLSELDDAPDALAAHAEKGVPTMAALQEAFPAVARAALAEAQTVTEEAGAGERFTAFLRRQTNARSLSPRDGNDTDAILSRAEAALSDGDLSTALQELDLLEGAPAEAMSDWRARASERAEALGGLETLTEDENRG